MRKPTFVTLDEALKAAAGRRQAIFWATREQAASILKGIPRRKARSLAGVAGLRLIRMYDGYVFDPVCEGIGCVNPVAYGDGRITITRCVCRTKEPNEREREHFRLPEPSCQLVIERSEIRCEGVLCQAPKNRCQLTVVEADCDPNASIVACVCEPVRRGAITRAAVRIGRIA